MYKEPGVPFLVTTTYFSNNPSNLYSFEENGTCIFKHFKSNPLNLERCGRMTKGIFRMNPKLHVLLYLQSIWELSQCPLKSISVFIFFSEHGES